MRRLLLQIAVVLVTAACVAIPVLEIIGHYHHTFFSGHDTVASLAAVALCFAVAVPVVRAVLALHSEPLILRQRIVSAPLRSSPAFADVEVPLSGPPPPLRI